MKDRGVEEDIAGGEVPHWAVEPEMMMMKAYILHVDFSITVTKL